MTTVTFFGGVKSLSAADRMLARDIGAAIGRSGFTLQHGGYNGLMEDAAQGAANAGGNVLAITLAGADWGEFNPHVTGSVHLPTLGERLHRFLDNTDLVIAMGGGIGTLHELSAALWYASNIRPIPVWLTGTSAVRLAQFLRAESWIYGSPARPLGFLSELPDQQSFQQVFRRFTAARQPQRLGDLTARVHKAATCSGDFQLPSGQVLGEYFDEYLLAADPELLADVGQAMASLVPPDTSLLVGLALGGVPLTVALSAASGIPAGFMRPERKKYGTCRRLEGISPSGHHAVIVDDVVRTGSQVLDAAALLRAQGAHVSGAACVLDRELGGGDRLASHGITLAALLGAPQRAQESAS